MYIINNKNTFGNIIQLLKNTQQIAQSHSNIVKEWEGEARELKRLEEELDAKPSISSYIKLAMKGPNWNFICLDFSSQVKRNFLSDHVRARLWWFLFKCAVYDLSHISQWSC